MKINVRCSLCGEEEELGLAKVLGNSGSEVVYLCRQCLSERSEEIEDMITECFVCGKKFNIDKGFAQVEQLQSYSEDSVASFCSKHCYANFLHSGLSNFDMVDEMDFCDFCKKEINGLAKAGINFFDGEIVDTWNFCSKDCYFNHVKREIEGKEGDKNYEGKGYDG